MSKRFRFLVCASLALGAFAVSSAMAAEPLPKQIDKLIAAGMGDVKSAGPADDAEFLRRAYLDFAGRIPTVAEARAFLADKSADKRAKLVDTLINGKEYPRRMTEAFSAMLMERRGEQDDWKKFLTTSFEKNIPWDAMVRNIVDPNDADADLRGAAYFAVNRLSKVGQQDTDYPGLTRDLARLMLGMDLQCAQCHNHLFIDDYKQVDFQGLYTVYLNTAIRTDVQFPALRENLMTKKIEFMSVFDQKPLTVGPRVPGMQEVSIPSMPKGEEYIVAPDPKTKKVGIPKFSPLEELAEQITAKENVGFRENIANRLWWLVMGRGLVDPLDQRHSDNPPSHPELLTLLSKEIAARKYDIKSMLADLAKSDVYARSSDWPNEGKERRPAETTYAVAKAKPLSAEQMYHSVTMATGPHAAEAGVDKLRPLFVSALANPAKEPELDFSPSVKAALFLMNDVKVLALFDAQPGNLVDRLAKQTDAAVLADELYLATLSRLPSDDEKKEVADFLKKHEAKRTAAIGQFAWALVSSVEFCLNH